MSLLKEVLECHCRLNDNQKLPLDFELLESQPEAGDAVFQEASIYSKDESGMAPPFDFQRLKKGHT